MRSIYFDHYTLYIRINYTCNYKIVMSNVFPSNFVKLDVFAESGSNTDTYNAIMCARCAVSYLLWHSYADIKVVLLTSTRAKRMFCKNY